DKIMFEVQINTGLCHLPSALSKAYVFSLPIHISPVNEMPRQKAKVAVPSFRSAAFTRRPLSSDIYNADDSDNAPNEILFDVIQFGNGSNDTSFLENVKHPGVPIKLFTQVDVNKQLINYVHKGSERTRIALHIRDAQSSDGTSISINVDTFPLKLHLKNN